MACEDDSDWLDARIERTKELIVKVEDAIDALTVGAVASYTLDTGQTRQTVTKQSIGTLRLQLDQLENRLSTLQARRCGASTRVIPGW
jgi:hypothetical protein